MTIASIDIGSNTILLLIAEYNRNQSLLTPILNIYRVPRISANLKSSQFISDAKIIEMWNVLEEYNSIIRDYQCAKTLVVGTNALRIARNGSEIVNRIRKEFDWNVNIIDGNEEARLSFLGTYTHSDDLQNYSVLDIGGGSTEIISGNRQQIFFRKSYNIGVVALTEKYIKHNPPLKQEVEKLNEEIKLNIHELADSLLVNTDLVAVAGTPATLSCINQGLRIYNDNLVDNSILTRNDILSITEIISKMKSDEISKIYGKVVEGREDVLLAGCLVLQNFMNFLNIEKIKVSSRGLRYGVLLDYINRSK
jgi:exopolyphosphatase/guanosine-5'-triphosphate,3'-diphosphate pyrophosphatase